MGANAYTYTALVLQQTSVLYVLYLLTYLYIINDSDKQEHNVRSQFLRVVQLEDYYFIIVSVRELVN